MSKIKNSASRIRTLKEIIKRRNESIRYFPREVVFCKIERPSKFKDRISYILESLLNAIFRVDGHVYAEKVGTELSEDFVSPEHSVVTILTIWECISCHYRVMMIMKEERIYP